MDFVMDELAKSSVFRLRLQTGHVVIYLPTLTGLGERSHFVTEDIEFDYIPQ